MEASEEEIEDGHDECGIVLFGVEKRFLEEE